MIQVRFERHQLRRYSGGDVYGPALVWHHPVRIRGGAVLGQIDARFAGLFHLQSAPSWSASPSWTEKGRVTIQGSTSPSNCLAGTGSSERPTAIRASANSRGSLHALILLLPHSDPQLRTRRTGLGSSVWPEEDSGDHQPDPGYSDGNRRTGR